MSVAETIMVAEEKVAGIQDQLAVVESVLETAEHITVTAEKTGRGLRRVVKVLLVISVIAAIAMVVKKLMGDRCSMGKEEEVVIETSETSETVDTDSVDDAPADDETAPEGDADAS